MRRLLALTSTAALGLALSACSLGDSARNTGQDPLPLGGETVAEQTPTQPAPRTPPPAPSTAPTSPTPSPSGPSSGPASSAPSASPSTSTKPTSGTPTPSATPTTQAPITGWGDVQHGTVTNPAQADALPIDPAAKAWLRGRATAVDTRCSGTGVTVKQFGANGWMTLSPNGRCASGTPTDVYKKIGNDWKIYFSFGSGKPTCSDGSWQSLPQEIKAKWPCA